MFRKITGSFLLAFENIRSQLFHTLLSVLGIVIGVAALVAILCLIDGMEKYAKDQIANTTSLNALIIRTDAWKRVNDVRVKKDSFAVINYDHFVLATSAMSRPAQSYLRARTADEVRINDLTIGTALTATNAVATVDGEVEAGSTLTDNQVESKEAVALVNKAFLKASKLDQKTIIGKTVYYRNRQLKIIGVLKKEFGKDPEIAFPITLLTTEELKNNPPEFIIEARSVEDVSTLKDEMSKWLTSSYKNGNEDFSIFTNELRVQQAEQGFLVFRIIMGMIVGLSVLVGGIGVMNVLLISVTERTVEIGIRKAVGANRRDIIFQFLAESITVSSFGSIIGLILGILMTMAFVPIINMLSKAPFQAAYTANTMIVISVVTLIVGIVFGTYPAIRASKLDPVEAIRRE
jgi:putative ABC transport system permease protein